MVSGAPPTTPGHAAGERPVALVTGASRGIGAGIARRFAADGYVVVLNYRSSVADAEQVAKEIRAGEGTCHLVAADVADPDAVDAMMAEVLDLTGRLDVLVNNAGIAVDHLVASMPPQAWRDVMDVNVGGAFHCTRAAVKPFAARRFGRIVNISSIMGEHGWVGQANYAASKAALNALTKVCAVELARFGVTTNAVLAGMVPTDLVRGLLAKDGGRGVSRQVPTRRFGEAQEVAAAVAFLAREDSAYVNGALLTVDGGMSAQLGQGRPL